MLYQRNQILLQEHQVIGFLLLQVEHVLLILVFSLQGSHFLGHFDQFLCQNLNFLAVLEVLRLDDAFCLVDGLLDYLESALV